MLYVGKDCDGLLESMYATIAKYRTMLQFAVNVAYSRLSLDANSNVSLSLRS